MLGIVALDNTELLNTHLCVKGPISRSPLERANGRLHIRDGFPIQSLSQSLSNACGNALGKLSNARDGRHTAAPGCGCQRYHRENTPEKSFDPSEDELLTQATQAKTGIDESVVCLSNPVGNAIDCDIIGRNPVATSVRPSVQASVGSGCLGELGLRQREDYGSRAVRSHFPYNVFGKSSVNGGCSYHDGWMDSADHRKQ